MAAGAGLLAGPRGSDRRILDEARPTRGERREIYDQRKAAKSVTQSELRADREAGRWTTPDDDLDDLDDLDDAPEQAGADAGRDLTRARDSDS